MTPEQKAVLTFHDAIGAYTARSPKIPPRKVRRLRLRLIREEL